MILWKDALDDKLFIIYARLGFGSHSLFHTYRPISIMKATNKITILLECPIEEVFDYKETQVQLPERARIFRNVTCEICGEDAPEHRMRLQDGKKVCMDCFKEYTRGW